MIRPPPIPVPTVIITALRGAARRPVEVLGERRDVGVVVDEDGEAGPLGDEVANRHVVDRQVDRGDRDAAVAVDRRRDAEADGGDAGAGGSRLLDLAHQQVEQLVLALAGRGLAALPEHLGLGVEDAEEHLRPAQVDPDRFPCYSSDELEMGVRGRRPRASA